MRVRSTITLWASLILVVGIAAALSWLGVRLADASRQRDVVSLIERAGGRVTFLDLDEDRNALSRDLFPLRYPRRVVEVEAYTDESLRHAVNLSQVDSLRLDGSVTDAGMVFVEQLKQLRSITVYGGRISDVGLAHFGELPCLEEVNLSPINHPRPTFSDASFDRLARLPALGNLYIYDAEITGARIEALKACPKLRRLSIISCQVTDPHMQHIASLGQVQSLRLEDMAISDHSLAYLSGLGQLTRLSLEGTAVTDQGLQSVAPLTQLEHLCLKNTVVSDGGVACLSSLKSLKSLNLYGTRCTPSGVAKLKAALPDASVYLLADSRTVEPW